MLRLTDVVRHLLIINVLLFFGTQLLTSSGFDRGMLAMHYPSMEDFQPFQIISHMFMHGDLAHLFFNMFSLAMFGPLLESLWGSKRFLFYYLFTGFGALALQLITNFVEIQYFGGFAGSMWGASGAIFGILIGCGMKFPNMRIQLLFPPIPMKMKYMAIFMIIAELFIGVRGLMPGIAHFAHLGGALFGFLLILYWQKFGSRL